MELDIYQEQAVLSTAPNTVVTACAGAGKTKVIIERTKLLADSNPHPSIVLITYTNGAAEEFRARLPKETQAMLIYSGTIHGYCRGLMQDELGVRIIVMDEEETMAELELLRASLSIKATGKDLERIARRTDRPADGFLTPLDLLYRTWFNDQFHKMQRFSFSGLIGWARQLVEKADMFNINLIVDEYQDVGKDTHDLLQNMNVKTRFVCGDVNQAIYSFIGGSPEHLLALKANCTMSGANGWRHFELHNTYRCTQPVVDTANAVIHSLPTRLVMETKSEGFGTATAYRRHSTTVVELAELAGELTGYEPEQVSCVAVICRTNALCEEARNVLKSSGVPVKAKIQKSQLQGLNTALLFLEYAAHPENEHLTKRVMSLVKSPAQFDDLTRASLKIGKSMPGLLKYGIADGAEAVDWAYGHASGSIVDPMKAVPKTTFSAITRALNEMAPHSTVEDLIFKIRSPDFEPAEISSEYGVTVTTAHGAKGKEWDYVYIVGANECYWRGAADEERRLFYVAVTRAKLFVNISWSQLCSRWQKGRTLEPAESEPIPAVAEAMGKVRPPMPQRGNMPAELESESTNKREMLGDFNRLDPEDEESTDRDPEEGDRT